VKENHKVTVMSHTTRLNKDQSAICAL